MNNKIRNQLRDALVLDNDGMEGFRGELCLNKDFVGYEGHFPDEPVLPGICMIAAVLVAAQEHLGLNLRIKTIKSAKFYAPARPGDRLTVKGQVQKEHSPIRISGSITSEEGRVGKVSLIAEIQNRG